MKKMKNMDLGEHFMFEVKKGPNRHPRKQEKKFGFKNR